MATVWNTPSSPPLAGSSPAYGEGSGVSGCRAVARMDQTLIYVTIALVLIGLMSVYTASAAQAGLETGNTASVVIKQIISVVIGAVGLVFLSRFSFERLKRLVYPFGGFCLGLLLLTMVIGTTANGSERWIMLPFGFQFQPSDLAKVAAIMLMAHATSQRRLWSGPMFVNLALVGGMVALILQQPNLSVSIILSVVTLALLFVSGVSLWWFSTIVPVLGILVGYKIWNTEYQRRRITGWWDPWADASDTGYNLIQSYYAIGSGGLFGVGLGQSIQKLYYLPFQHTDFIFSVICEEWGFVGALIVLGLFVLLGWRGFTIAWHCPSRFGRMLAFGLTLAIVLQALINICVTVGLMPVTGVTLPLISYGGTSMIVTLAMIGMLLNISRYRPVMSSARIAEEAL